MENYRINQRLGKGSQGSVYLVKHKDDGEDYVLKKIECNDEYEANKAFMEAKALDVLKHRFICGYKEFFVTWDKEQSAMFVCIVMDYYQMGDLDRVLKQNRSKHTSIEEMVLKKWIGQILEAVVFVHQKNIIHRDLKPSNILVTEDLDISIGDFGVSTIMSESRTKTRTTVGSMNWMAPEVLQRPYDERSDVWSMGCIFLEMATCGLLDYAQITHLLMDIKTKPQALEDILEQIAKIYNPSLCQAIRTMLRLNFQQRTTASELIELPYMQECLALNESPLLPGSKKNSPDKKTKKNTSEVPTDKGIEGILSFMEKNSNDPNSLFNALKTLLEYPSEELKLSQDAKRLVSELMRKHITKVNIQILACRLLAVLATEAHEENDILYSRQVISPVALAMKSHPSSVDLQAAATQLLMALSADESAASEIGRLGGVQDTLAALRNFPNNVEIAVNCCSAFWSLCIDEANAKIVTEERGLQDICQAMDTHMDTPHLMEAACSAIWSLSMEEENIEMMSDFGTIRLILLALKKHQEDARVVKNACMALATIVEADESYAYDVLRGDEDDPGCAILLDAFTHHRENEEVAENFACCVTELAQYYELKNEMKARNFDKALEDIQLKFALNPDVLHQIDEAATALGGERKVRSNSLRSRPRSARR
ncbi:serine/threonine kinase-like domain-containing protein STKLD1 [Clytia hemisphaerica]|uniref:non-specific serine/threonine protein kinase n=2 Tax=Clytia hemisphaerica TaxID=252671 RepID=A0A7M5WUA0_9CNID